MSKHNEFGRAGFIDSFQNIKSWGEMSVFAAAAEQRHAQIVRDAIARQEEYDRIGGEVVSRVHPRIRLRIRSRVRLGRWLEDNDLTVLRDRELAVITAKDSEMLRLSYGVVRVGAAALAMDGKPFKVHGWAGRAAQRHRVKHAEVTGFLVQNFVNAAAEMASGKRDESIAKPQWLYVMQDDVPRIRTLQTLVHEGLAALDKPLPPQTKLKKFLAGLAEPPKPLFGGPV